MTITTERSAADAATGPPGADRRSRRRLGSTALAAVAIGMLAAATFRSGAFYAEVALGVAVLAVPLAIAGLRQGDDRRGVLVTLATVGLALWWLLRAVDAGSARAFFPFGASVAGFLAAFLAVRLLPSTGRATAAKAFAAIGAAAAAAGLVGVVTRWSAIATVNHGSWRAATSLTYANAAGLLVGMALLVALGVEGRPWIRNLGIALCTAGLIASQSVAGMVATAAGAAFVPVDRWKAHHRSVVVGGVVGIGVLATSTGGARPLWVLVAAAVGMAWGTRPVPAAGSSRRRTALTVIVAAAAVVVLVSALATGTHHLFGAESERTSIPWRTATDNWRQIGATGLGPQGIANRQAPVRVSDNLLGNDYLQVGVDAGGIGLLLLGAAVGAVGYAVRRRGVVSSCATGALVAFGVGGFVDYSWHLPAIALAGGVVGGLAAAPVGDRIGLLAVRPRRDGPSRSRRRLVWSAVAAGLVIALLAVGLGTGAPARPRLLGTGAGTFPLPTGPVAAAPADGDSPAPITPPGPGQFLTQGGADDTDPFILHEGREYYLFTSEGATRRNISVRVGHSLTSWGPAFEALPVLPPWADPGATWAPDVRHVKGGWALYFSALVHGIDPAEHCVGAAFGSSPTGPFVADPQPLVCQLDHRGTIDPRTFVDTDGQLILDFKSEDNANPRVPGPDQNGRTALWAQRLTPDGHHLVGPRTELLGPTQTWEGTIVESPQMVNLAGNYWLFFSGGWFNTPGYGIGYAICKGPFGPCTDLSPVPLLGSNAQGSGPGESSVYVDGGRAFLLYNPWHANDPDPTPPRPVAIAEIAFGTNGPHLVNG